MRLDLSLLSGIQNTSATLSRVRKIDVYRKQESGCVFMFCKIALILASYQGHLVEITKSAVGAKENLIHGSTTKSTMFHTHLADPIHQVAMRLILQLKGL